MDAGADAGAFDAGAGDGGVLDGGGGDAGAEAVAGALDAGADDGGVPPGAAPRRTYSVGCSCDSGTNSAWWNLVAILFALRVTVRQRARARSNGA